MTRLKLIPWLAIPALLLTFSLALPTASAAPPAKNDNLIYGPLSGHETWLKQGTNTGLKTSVAGQVTIAQYGLADGIVGSNLGMLAVRFDPPFNAPYTITGINFPTRTTFNTPTALPGVIADGTNIVTRCSGSFITSGVEVGDVFSGPGVLFDTRVTAVAATSLTLTNPVAADFPTVVGCIADGTTTLTGSAGSFTGVGVGACVSGPPAALFAASVTSSAATVSAAVPFDSAGTSMVPDGDLSVGGWYAGTVPATIPLFSRVDEAVVPIEAGSDFIESPAGGAPCELSLRDPVAAPVGVARVRYRAVRVGPLATTLMVELREGGLTRASFTSPALGAAFANFSYTLTASELASVGNWNDVSVRLTASASGSIACVSQVFMDLGKARTFNGIARGFSKATGRFTSVRIQSMEAGDAGPTSLWSKQRAISCSADNTTTLTRAAGSFAGDGVAIGDRVVGPKVANPTFVTSVGTTSLTTDVAVSPSATVAVSASIPAARAVANVQVSLPSARAVAAVKPNIPLPRGVTCGAVIPAPRVITCNAIIPSGSFFTLQLERAFPDNFATADFVQDVRVGDVVSHPNVSPGTTVLGISGSVPGSRGVDPVTAKVTLSNPVIFGFTGGAVTFTTPSTGRLRRPAGGVFVTIPAPGNFDNDVRVGDLVTGPSIPPSTRVAALATSTTFTPGGLGQREVILETALIPGVFTPTVFTTSFSEAVTFTTPPPTNLLIAPGGAFGSNAANSLTSVRLGDIATSASLPAGTLVSEIVGRANPANQDTIRVNKTLSSYFLETVTFSTLPPTTNLVRAAGSFVTDGVLVGDVASGPSIPVGAKVAAVAATVVTLDMPMFGPAPTPLETVTFTTPAVRRLTRASGSFINDGVLVGDVVSGSPDIAAGAAVATVLPTAVTLNADITASLVNVPVTFTSAQPEARSFHRPSIRAWLDRVPVRTNGEMNSIPLNISANPGETYFVVFQFPPFPATADTFPFLYTDREFTEKGLFANSYATDSSAVIRIPPDLGTIAGTTLFANQNLVVSMNCTLSGDVPMNSPKNAGLNLRDSAAEWTFGEPDAGVLMDGEATTAKTNQVELVKRDLTWGLVANAGASSGKVPLPAVPGSGTQIWGLRGKANNGTTSLVSNVTISGPTSIVGYPAIAEDADEANGKDTDVEAAAVSPPFADRPETLWPAGDIDNYTFFAQPGQAISVKATPVHAGDLLSKMKLVVNVLDNSHDLVESEIGGPGAVVTLQHVAAPPSGNSGSKAFKRYFVQVYDRSGSPEDLANWNRVLVPGAYKLDVDVFTPSANLLNDPQLSGQSEVPDEFSFANAGSNPVRDKANFRYGIPRWNGETSVKLRVYDVRGRLVSSLVHAAKAPGMYFASWSGQDRGGNRVGAGTYFARIQAGSFSRTVRIVMN